RNERVGRAVSWHERDEPLAGEAEQRVICEAVGVIFHVVALKEEDPVLGPRHELVPQALVFRLILFDSNRAHWKDDYTGQAGLLSGTRRTRPAVRFFSRPRVTDHVRAVLALR